MVTRRIMLVPAVFVWCDVGREFLRRFFAPLPRKSICGRDVTGPRVGTCPPALLSPSDVGGWSLVLLPVWVLSNRTTTQMGTF